MTSQLMILVAGPCRSGDAAFDEIFHPVARELIGKCDAVLRLRTSPCTA